MRIIPGEALIGLTFARRLDEAIVDTGSLVGTLPPLGSKMKKSHLRIHFWYVAGILGAVAVGQASLHLSSDKDISALLSFAIGLTSLILALIAIIQNIVAAPQLTLAMERLAGASDSVQASTRLLENASAMFSGHVESIRVLPQQIQALPSQIVEVLNKAGAGYDKAAPQPPSEVVLSVSSPASAAAQYFLARAAETSRKSNPFEVFKPPYEQLAAISTGYAAAMKDLGFLDFGYNDGFESLRLSKVMPGSLLKKGMDGKDDGIAQAAKRDIDEYFK